MCRRRWEYRTIIKYADDSVTVILLQDKETVHGPVIDDFVKWCEKAHFQFIDSRKNAHAQEIIFIKGQKVKCVPLNVCNLIDT